MWIARVARGMPRNGGKEAITLGICDMRQLQLHASIIADLFIILSSSCAASCAALFGPFSGACERTVQQDRSAQEGARLPTRHHLHVPPLHPHRYPPNHSRRPPRRRHRWELSRLGNLVRSARVQGCRWRRTEHRRSVGPRPLAVKSSRCEDQSARVLSNQGTRRPLGRLSL